LERPDQGTILAFVWRNYIKLQKTSVRRAGIVGNLANTSLEQYHYIIQLDMMMVVMVMVTVVDDVITEFIIIILN
jgi:hypothetical protein